MRPVEVVDDAIGCLLSEFGIGATLARFSLRASCVR